MSRKSNDSIEDFFKKGVRKNDITFRESDWQKMEKMLDEQAMVGTASTSRLVKRGLAAVTLLALLSASVYLLLPDNSQASLQSSMNEVSANDDNAVGNPATKEPGADKNHEVLDRPASVEAADQQATNPSQTALASSLSGDDISPASTSATTGANTKSAAVTSVNQTSSKQQKKSNGQASAQEKRSVDARQSALTTSGVTTSGQVSSTSKSRGEQPASAVAPSQENESVAENSENVTEGNTIKASSLVGGAVVVSHDPGSTSRSQTETVSPATSRASSSLPGSEPVDAKSTEANNVNPTTAAVGAESTATKNQQSNTSESNESEKALAENEATEKSDAFAKEQTANDIVEEDKEKKNFIESRWNVAVFAAPEWSATSMDKMTTPGTAYGITIGYRVIKGVVITAGIIKTHKKYLGYGEDYQPPYGYWSYKTNGVVPDEIDGQCEVIEIPLIVQVDVWRKNASRVYFAGGVSSYRMLNEYYNYYFDEPNDGAATGWSTTTPSSYPFSIGHLSAAYEHRLYKGLSIGIEPYVKIPFKGIGWSNVELLTMGTYVNVRYRFLKKEL